VPALAPHRYTAVVGWDEPLQTFFAQIYANSRISLWVGTNFQELPEVDDLQNAISSHVELDSQTRADLFFDREDRV
jgi:hypothetical protein